VFDTADIVNQLLVILVLVLNIVRNKLVRKTSVQMISTSSKSSTRYLNNTIRFDVLSKSPSVVNFHLTFILVSRNINWPANMRFAFSLQYLTVKSNFKLNRNKRFDMT
jgi:hypothetical protein